MLAFPRRFSGCWAQWITGHRTGLILPPGDGDVQHDGAAVTPSPRARALRSACVLIAVARSCAADVSRSAMFHVNGKKKTPAETGAKSITLALKGERHERPHHRAPRPAVQAREAIPMALQPLKLSDDELDAIMSAAQPLDRDRRGSFLEAVASALARHDGEIGVGTVYAICVEQQRKFFDPPSGHAGTPQRRLHERRATADA